MLEVSPAGTLFELVPASVAVPAQSVVESSAAPGTAKRSPTHVALLMFAEYREFRAANVGQAVSLRRVG
jgi:hypothetical protein